jgi:hypothetical protein
VGYQIAGFVTGHNFLIGKDGRRYGVLEEHNAETNCQIAFERALYHFYRNECEAAAYYLGCMVHFISDVSCFPHVLPNIYANDIQREGHGLKITLKGLHKSYERQVSNLMNHPYWCNPINFDTNKHQWNHQIMGPTLAISGCARDTFFGDQGHGAIWMYEHVAAACIYDKVQAVWRFPAKDIRYEPQYQELFRCIERDMNKGIFYSAAAVQFIYDTCLGSLQCNCDQNSHKKEVSQYLYEFEIIQMMQEMSFLVGFCLIGKISAVVAQVLVKNKLEKLAIPI